MLFLLYVLLVHARHVATYARVHKALGKSAYIQTNNKHSVILPLKFAVLGK